MDAPPLANRFASIRRRTVELCAPLTIEDQLVQTMPEASPAKWHLAHTTWFFETFVLASAEPFDPAFAFLFNSYYEAVGTRVERGRRGSISRPSLERVHAYRAAIDRRVGAAIVDGSLDPAARDRLELGLQHEQQHQELILTDIKHVLGTQPLRPAYRADLPRTPTGGDRLTGWLGFDGGVVEIGAASDGFAFDNERPRHRVFVAPFELATRPVSNAEVLAFIADGGYRDPRHWLSDGWATVQAEGWDAPLYWERRDGAYVLYELAGVRAVDPAEPACHVSSYEADAIARWAGARLPTEMEWELAATGADPARGHFADDDGLHPRATDELFGDVWQWTSSSHAPYPGFHPLAGALGEYNGKFMSGQYVLRGGSCFTPRDHIRASYRNFFPPRARWQMSGLRLARD